MRLSSLLLLGVLAGLAEAAKSEKCVMNECACATSESWDASGTCGADGGETLGQSRPTTEIAQGETLFQTGASGFVRAIVDAAATPGQPSLREGWWCCAPAAVLLLGAAISLLVKLQEVPPMFETEVQMRLRTVGVVDPVTCPDAERLAYAALLSLTLAIAASSLVVKRVAREYARPWGVSASVPAACQAACIIGIGAVCLESNKPQEGILYTALAAVSSSRYLTVTNSYMYSTTCLP